MSIFTMTNSIFSQFELTAILQKIQNFVVIKKASKKSMSYRDPIIYSNLTASAVYCVSIKTEKQSNIRWAHKNELYAFFYMGTAIALYFPYSTIWCSLYFAELWPVIINRFSIMWKFDRKTLNATGYFDRDPFYYRPLYNRDVNVSNIIVFIVYSVLMLLNRCLSTLVIIIVMRIKFSVYHMKNDNFSIWKLFSGSFENFDNVFLTYEKFWPL